MRTFYYQCTNDKCDTKEVKMRSFKTSTGATSRFCADDKFALQKEDDDKEPELCPICEQEMKNTGEDNPVFLGTTLMSIDQKRAMMLNRSKAHERTGVQRDNRADAMQKSRKEFGG